jgi:hypothetical protein
MLLNCLFLLHNNTIHQIRRYIILRKKMLDMIPVLPEQIQNILYDFSTSRSLPASLVKRAKIILMASQGINNRKIAYYVNLHYINVATWRNRFLLHLPTLKELEATESEKLSAEIISILSDEKRSGSSSKFTPVQITKILDLACKNPRDFGYEVSQWSLSLLKKEIIRQGIADQISEKSVSRFLKMR